VILRKNISIFLFMTHSSILYWERWKRTKRNKFWSHIYWKFTK